MAVISPLPLNTCPWLAISIGLTEYWSGGETKTPWVRVHPRREASTWFTHRWQAHSDNVLQLSKRKL